MMRGKIDVCERCHGARVVLVREKLDSGETVERWVECPDCLGEGVVEVEPCDDGNG